jgi:hypothetical protein
MSRKFSLADIDNEEYNKIFDDSNQLWARFVKIRTSMEKLDSYLIPLVKYSEAVQQLGTEISVIVNDYNEWYETAIKFHAKPSLILIGESETDRSLGFMHYVSVLALRIIMVQNMCNGIKDDYYLMGQLARFRKSQKSDKKYFNISISITILLALASVIVPLCFK